MSTKIWLIRLLQGLLAAAAIAMIVVGLSVFGVLDLPIFDVSGTVQEIGTSTVRVTRQNVIKNPTYQQFLTEGDTSLYRGNFTKALEAYQQASELEPKEVGPYEKIGDVFFLQRKYESALQNFELAESLNPAGSSAKIKVVRSLLGMRKIIDAKTKVEAIVPPSQASLYYQGLIAAFLNDQNASKDLLTKSLTAGVDETLKSHAQKFLTIYRDFELARDAKTEYLQAQLAQGFDQAGENGLAIELAFDAIKTQHDYRDVWIILGHAFLNEEKWLDAEDSLAKAIDLDASHPAAFFYRGIARRNLQKQADAITDFESALKLGWQPRIAAKLQLADIYFDRSDFAKAYPLYKEVATTDASEIRRFIRPMALAINHLQLPKEALELGQKAYDAHPDTAMGENLLGWGLFANGDLIGAHQHLESAIKRDPELAAAYLNLGQLAEKEGNITNALQKYELALEFAQKSGDDSISETARTRISILETANASNGTSTPTPPMPAPAPSPQPAAATPQNQPQPQQTTPSLSLL